MNSIAILDWEHALVLRILKCLDALADQAHHTAHLDREAACEVLSLLERFVDWNHQDKEELHLFPRMLARATAHEATRLGKLFNEHSEERRRLIGMHLHLDEASAGNEADLDRFVIHAKLYVKEQKKHLREEERFVLPLAETVLTREDDLAITRGFLEVDRRLGSPNDVVRRVSALCQRLGVETPTRLESHPKQKLLVP